MALNWQWDECFGELEIENQGDYKIRIYQGNAFAIFLTHWTNENNVAMWNMYNFFVSKDHFTNCTKDKLHNYAEGWKKITLWRVPSNFWQVLKDLHKRGVRIEILNEKPQ